MKNELVRTSAKLARYQLAEHDRERVAAPLAATRRCNSARSEAERLAYVDVLNDHLQFPIQCNVAFTHAPQTLHEAQIMLQDIGIIERDSEILDSLCHLATIGKHALFLTTPSIHV